MNEFTHRIAWDWHRTLETVLERSRAAGRAAMVVFDLDSTVFDNRPRQARILREYAAAHDVEPLKCVHAQHFTKGGWDLGEPWRAAGLTSEWDVQARAFKGYWAQRFFSSDYCLDDIEIVGAPRYLNLLHQTGVRLVYVTGRHEAMREGSVACLRKCGMPIPAPDEQVKLIMKPTLREDDDAYKRAAHALLRSMGQVIAAFDNEPTHVNDYAVQFPDALAVHLATDHSGRPVTLESRVISIPHFAW